MAPLHSFSHASLSGGAAAVRAGERAARLGYVSRAVESRDVSQDHERRRHLRAVVDGRRSADARHIMQAAARLTARVAHRPDGDDGDDGDAAAPLVPGLDPAARQEIAAAALDGSAPASARVEKADLCRAWTYGYLVHAVAEACDYSPARA